MDTKTIKATDRVWIGSPRAERRYGLKTVLKVTPTQIVIDWNGNGLSLPRFKRESGCEIGKSWMPNRITGIGTKSECGAFDLAAQMERESAMAKVAADAAREALRVELSGLFTGGHVEDEQWDDRIGFTLSFHGLTEQAIRGIAVKLAAPAPSTMVLTEQVMTGPEFKAKFLSSVPQHRRRELSNAGEK